MTPTPELRWGFLGASRIGRRALGPAVQAAGHVLHAVAARDIDRAREFAAAFGAARAYGSYAELIADPDVDAVYVALTNDAHLAWTLRALDAGKHVLCEKPLAMSAAEVAQMAEAERASGCRVLEAFAYRFSNQMVRLRAVIDTGVLGRRVCAHVSFGSTMPDDDFRWIAPLGGGGLYDVGCYCVDLLRWVLDDEPVRVTAFQDERGGVDATLGGLMEFGGGAIGQFTCSFVAARRQHLAITGSNGAISLDWPFAAREPEIRLAVNGAVEMIGPSDPYVRMVTHFGEAIRGQVALRHPLAHSLPQAYALDALFASARGGGRLVTIPPGRIGDPA